ncbi:hypothetical protein AAG906_007931 [Vitis piasezkii]
MFREIATNVRHGLRRKFLLILGGLTQVPLFMFLIRCGFLTIRTLNQNESSIVVGNGVKVPVVATGHFVYF